MTAEMLPPPPAQALARTDRLLRRASTSGHRLETALYLILTAHGARVTGDAYVCAVCCTAEGPVAYPCPTAKQATWALEAALG